MNSFARGSKNYSVRGTITILIFTCILSALAVAQMDDELLSDAENRIEYEKGKLSILIPRAQYASDLVQLKADYPYGFLDAEMQGMCSAKMEQLFKDGKAKPIGLGDEEIYATESKAVAAINELANKIERAQSGVYTSIEPQRTIRPPTTIEPPRMSKAEIEAMIHDRIGRRSGEEQNFPPSRYNIPQGDLGTMYPKSRRKMEMEERRYHELQREQAHREAVSAGPQAEQLFLLREELGKVREGLAHDGIQQLKLQQEIQRSSQAANAARSEAQRALQQAEEARREAERARQGW